MGTARHIKLRPMPGAHDDGSLTLTLRKRGASMRAGVIDGVEGALYVINAQLAAVNGYLLDFARCNFADRGYFRKCNCYSFGCSARLADTVILTATGQFLQKLSPRGTGATHNLWNVSARIT